MTLITRKDMTTWRSPSKQKGFAQDVWNAIYNDASEKHQARLNQGDYKEFREEFYPFSHLCCDCYQFPESVKCRLSPDPSANHDGQVELVDGSIHQFELTRIIDGKLEKQEMRTLNDKGLTGLVWKGAASDTELQRGVADHTLLVAQGKALKDYRSSTGNSTLVIQVSCEHFFLSHPPHREVFDSMLEQLKSIEYQVSEVVLMSLSFDESSDRRYEYIRVK